MIRNITYELCNRRKWNRILFITKITTDNRINHALVGGTRLAAKLREFTEPLGKIHGSMVVKYRIIVYLLCTKEPSNIPFQPVTTNLDLEVMLLAPHACILDLLQNNHWRILQTFHYVGSSLCATSPQWLDPSWIRADPQQKQAQYASHILKCRSARWNSMLQAVLLGWCY